MFKATDTKHAPWYIPRSDDKKRARLNCITHILNLIPYKKVPREKVELPKREMKHTPTTTRPRWKGRKFVAENIEPPTKTTRGKQSLCARNPSCVPSCGALLLTGLGVIIADEKPAAAGRAWPAKTQCW